MTTGVISVPRRDGDKAAAAARARFRPWFVADWRDALFVHYSIEPRVLQAHVPFELDLRDGKAWVSLVAFAQRRMRPAVGGRWTAWTMAPVAAHEFLNLRTYVRGNDGVTGICFLAEWIPNRLARAIGPALYGLPFRLAELKYQAERRRVAVGRNRWEVEVRPGAGALGVARRGTVEDFLLERYTAYTARGGRGYRFDIRHEPWDWRAVHVRVVDDSLLRRAAPWYGEAELWGAHRSGGLVDVLIGGPSRVTLRCATS